MVYPTPGFIVRQTFLEFEGEESHRPSFEVRDWRRVSSDSNLALAAKRVSLYGSEDLRLYCEGEGARSRDSSGCAESSLPSPPALATMAAEAPAAQPLDAPPAAEAAAACCPTAAALEERTAELAGTSVSSSASPAAGTSQGCTTLLFQGLPAGFSRRELLDMLNAEGFMCYDFVFVPCDLLTKVASGYAYVNFRTTEDASRAMQHFEGFTRWPVPSSSVCSVTWSRFSQGLHENIERYRNSPVMHEKVPDSCKPMLFVLGAPCPFPAPTRRVRIPRVRGKARGRQAVCDAEDAAAAAVSTEAPPT